MTAYTRTLAQAFSIPDGTRDGLTIQGPMNAAGVFGGNTIGSVINRAIPYILAIAGIGLLIMIIGAGFSLLTSVGDAKKMEKGKNQLTYGIVGVIVILIAFWIVQIAGRILGIDEITNIF